METKKEINEQKLKDIMRKIKGIFAKAESLKKDAEEFNDAQKKAEAENLALGATRLLQQYNLSMADISAHELDQSMGEVHIAGKTVRPNTEGKWITMLYNIIAKFNYCMAYGIDHGHNGLKIVGEKNNVEIVQYICEQLIHRMRRSARDSWKDYYNNALGDEKEGTFLRGYLMGCVLGIKAKLQAEQDSQIKSHPQTEGLIKVHDSAVARYIEKSGTKLKNRKVTGTKSKDGEDLGFEAGRNMDIHKGLGDSGKKDQLRLGSGALRLGAGGLSDEQKEKLLEHFKDYSGNVEVHELLWDKKKDHHTIADYLENEIPKEFDKKLVKTWFKELWNKENVCN